jgi:hypothetical protein
LETSQDSATGKIAPHPRPEKEMGFEPPLPEDFRDALKCPRA